MKAIVVLGKENGIERYSLLIGNEYVSRDYNPSKENYQNFVEEVSSDFSDLIVNAKGSLELGVLNGIKIEGNKTKKVEKVENNLFNSLLQNKIIKQNGNSKMIFPATNVN